MFNAVLLDVFIGLAFFYLLFSLVLASINEMIAGVIKMRNGFLEKAMVELLGNKKFVGLFYKHPLIRGFGKQSGILSWICNTLMYNKIITFLKIDWVITKLRIPFLYDLLVNGRPSYLSSHTFSLVIFDLLEGGVEGIKKRYQPIVRKDKESKTVFLTIDGVEYTGDEIDSWLKKFSYFTEMIPPTKKREEYAEEICTLLRNSIEETDVHKLKQQFGQFAKLVNTVENAVIGSGDEREKVKSSIAGWFDLQMERVTGLYKRRTQLILFVVGLTFCIFLNADTFMMADVLWSDPVVRDAVVAEAKATAEQKYDPGKQSAEELNSTITGSPCSDCKKESATDIAQKSRLERPFPVGWSSQRSATFEEVRSLPNNFAGWFYKIIGILITSFLISLGAPFWFDALSKLVNLRNAGVKPKTAPKSAATAE